MSEQVYFFHDAVSSAVKIGLTAGRVQKRLTEIRVGNPNHVELLGIIDGGIASEKAWHVEFSDSHIRGEWFEATERLLGAISERAYLPSKFETHPLRHWLNENKLSVVAFSEGADFSYVTVYRLLKREGGFSTETLKDISEKTGGAVTVGQLADSLTQSSEAA